MFRSSRAVLGLLAALSSALLWGCATQSAMVSLTIAVPSAPQSAEETLIADALTRALVDEQDFPDYASLRTIDTLIVLSDYRSGEAIHSFGAGALPHLSSFHFVLLTSKEVNRLSQRGRVEYLSVEIRGVTAESTRIEVRRTVRGRSDVLVPRLNSAATYEPIDDTIIQRRADIAHRGWFSTNGYILSYRRVDGGWEFVRVVGEID